MTMFTTFLESSLNFLSNNLKKRYKIGIVREKNVLQLLFEFWKARET